MTEEVDIVKVSSELDGPIIKFNCPRCKEGKRPWRNKESRVEITANKLKAHPFLDPDYDPSNRDLSDEFAYQNFQEQLDITKFIKDNE